MPELDNDTLLGLWLDGQLTDAQRAEFERRITSDEAFSNAVETANQFHMHAEHYQDAEVPGWNRDATFEVPEARRWWQWQGLPAFSMAMSAFALVLVISGTQFHYQDGVFTVSLGNQINQQQVEQAASEIVEQRLTDFAQQQELALTTYAAALQQQQQTTNAELTSYLLSSSRQERREDFAELISFINQQRSDDQLFYARQINQLQQELFVEPGALTAPPAQQE